MSEAQKHTPGPWQYRHLHHEAGAKVYYITTKGRLLAKVHNFCADTKEALPSEANAFLIAAAPDLIAACEAQEAMDAHYSACEDCRHEAWCDTWAELNKAARTLRRAALAKAAGEAG